MRLFIYKVLIIFLCLFIFYQLTIGYTISRIESKFYSINLKEQSNFIKSKIRKEIENSLKKENILNEDDAILFNNFIKKILKEINIR